MRSRISFAICTLLLVGWMPVIGCGGSGKPTPPAPAAYTIGGTVSGVLALGLVLQNNGGGNLTVGAKATSFAFAGTVESGGVYSVTVLTQPAGEVCAVANGSGTATANVSNVSITCVPLYTIGGSISGLKGPGLVLQDNGGDNLAVSSNASSFTFPTPLASGAAYKVTVLSQPAGQNCVVTNGAGTATANVTNADIVCTQLYAIGGTVTGLHGKGLVLQDNGGDNLALNADATSFVFPSPLAAGSRYSIAVLTQPGGENCSVANGSGTVSTDVLDAGIICVGEWSWMGGSNALGLNLGQPGVYGTLGTSSPTNIPGGRTQSATWKDASGNTWLFGGYGYDSTGKGGQLNDLWKFEPTKGTSGQWTWVSGNPTVMFLGPLFPNGQPGVYGTLGTAAPANAPGSREQSVSWIDASGNLWIFGGLGIDSVGMYGYLNDLWKFNPNLGANGEWTWMGGSSVVPPADTVILEPFGRNGVYGTLGSAAPANIPGGRYGAYAWTDASGNFWLYGGDGFDANGRHAVYLNDLWKYTPNGKGTAGSWTWMGGSSTVPPGPAPWIVGAEPGAYGTLGTPDPANVPGGHSSGAAWADASGNLWLFGGLGADSAGTVGYLNDLWMYTPGTGGGIGQWTWMGGNDTIGNNGGQPGVYGALGLPASENAPGARFSAASWTDASGNFWMFGGQGYDWIGTSGFLNDVWKYTPGADGGLGQWTWMGGSNIIPPSSASQAFGVQSGQPGIYGTLGVPAAANTPGARLGAVPWVDGSGNIWLFGGQGYDAGGSQGYLNDSWNYQP